MKIILIAVFILSMTETKNMRAFWAELSNHLQQRCLKLTNDHSKFKPELRAIVCGQSILSSERSFEIKRLGLIHIFVVSGAHFATLQIFLALIFTGFHKFFQRREQKTFPYLRLGIEHFLLGIFLLSTGLQAPALRSFLQSCWRSFAPWTAGSFLILGAGLLSFAWIPPSQHLSLQLSWYCALILFWPGLRGPWGYFGKSLLLFLGCSYFLSSLGTGTLMGVLSNLMLAPLISFGLFPLALLSLAIPSSIYLFDQLMSFFYFISLKISPDFYFETQHGTLNTTAHWFFLAALHLLLHWQHVSKHRKSHD